MALTLYHVSWCPECEVVREKLASLKLDYIDVIVPDARAFRQQVHEVSDQYYVPVLMDDDLVLTETEEILAYLDDRYGTDGGTAKPRPAKPSAEQTPASLGEDDQYPSCSRDGRVK
ncbi:MAG: hypothetical protein EPO64_05175 [Nitrospirae bacterium]|nr:MAG: hypothetical protein EPO64_05175 [Nitrospirota bacterium]